MAFDPWDEAGTAQKKADQQKKVDDYQRQLQDLESKKQAVRAAKGWGGAGSNDEIAALDAQKQSIADQQQQARMASQGLNPDGSPLSPEWHSLIDKNTGKLNEQYQMNLSGLDPSQWQGYQQQKQEALRAAGSPSQWAQLQMQKQSTEEAQARDAAQKQAMTGQSQALAGLGMRGGFGSGARTRLALEGQRNLMNVGQNVGQQGAAARLGIQTSDEESRQRNLAQLANSEADLGKYNKTFEGQQSQFNLNNLMQEHQGRRAAEQNTYAEQMKKWAAGRQADATMASQGGGGK